MRGLTAFPAFLYLLSFILPFHCEAYQQDQHEVTVTLKLVQVHVEDKNGEPVNDLKLSDFAVYDNGREVTLTEFEKHILAEDTQEPKLMEPADRRESGRFLNRKFFLFFDYEKNGPRGIIKSKQMALRFLKKKVIPSDEVSLLIYSPVHGLEVIEQPTHEHSRIIQSIQNLKAVPGVPFEHKMNEKIMDRQRIRLSPSTESPEPISDMDKGLFAYKTGSRISEGLHPLARQFTEKFIGAMRDLAYSLRTMPGMKNFVYFSAGYLRELLNSDQLFRSRYRSMVRDLSTANCPFYAVSTETPLNAITGGGSQGAFSLQMISRDSGGRFFGNIDDMENIMDDIQKTTGNYYVLGYYVNPKGDGSYHKLEVKLRGETLQKYKIYAQKGYYDL